MSLEAGYKRLNEIPMHIVNYGELHRGDRTYVNQISHKYLEVWMFKMGNNNIWK